MQRFINRFEEMDFLKSEYNRKESSLVILYGRRRVGKTALISEFGKDKEMIYFLATEESEDLNREQFKDLVAEHTKNEILRSSSMHNWAVVFDALIAYKPEQRKLIVIDEFQYLGKNNPAFPSVFQKIWDTKLQNENVMVVLCGSLISLMESQTLSYSSPLYGRRTGQIKLKQIPFRFYHEFFPEKQYRELIEYYSITGGVPKYMEMFRDCDDIYDAIHRHVLSKQSFLYEEPMFLLQKEVTEAGSYFSIIRAIAAGNHKLGNIAAVLELKSTGLTKYLKTLIDLDILEREVPVTEGNPEKSKKGLYRIKDNFIEFWFKLVYPNRNFIETGNTDVVIDKIRKSLVSRQISTVYEDICREKMWQLNACGELPFVFDKAGRWWDNKEEINIVAFDSTGQDIIFGECKYTNKKTDVDVFYALLEKTKAVSWNRQDRKEYFVFFSINGYTEQMKELGSRMKNIQLF